MSDSHHRAGATYPRGEIWRMGERERYMAEKMDGKNDG